MEIHESGENYLEAILFLQQKNGNVRSIDIANMLEFSKPSVSIAMKNLRKNGYVRVDNHGYITLLPSGQAIAEKILERHHILTDWLIDLGVSPDTAEDDACRIEHVVSAESFEALKKHIREHHK